MSNLYPPGPAQVPADLYKATSAYRRHAWLACFGLPVMSIATSLPAMSQDIALPARKPGQWQIKMVPETQGAAPS